MNFVGGCSNSASRFRRRVDPKSPDFHMADDCLLRGTSAAGWRARVRLKALIQAKHDFLRDDLTLRLGRRPQ